MKRIAIAAVITLALAGCGHVTSDAEDAAAACYRVVNPHIHDQCMANFVNTAQAGRDAQWSAIGNGMLSRRGPSSCMNVGGIISCR